MLMNVNMGGGGNLRTFTRDKNLNIVKGIGILLIILHNYFHTFPEFPPECEFKYAPENVSRFTEAMLSGNLRIIILSLFSFLGHYGVSIFVFVSGYGLSKRYDHSGESKWYIILRRAIQLWKWLVPMALLLILDRYSGHTHFTYAYLGNNKIWTDMLFMLTFTANGLADRFIIAGPWWYFGMAFQLYVIYALFLRKSSDKVLWGIIAGVWTLLIVLSSLGLDNCFFAFRYNSIGWLPVFCVGILLSRHPVYISWRWISLGVVLFVLSLFNRYLWVVSPILALFPVAAVLPLARKEPLQNVLLFMGKLSAALFVTHAFVRQQVLAHDQALPPEISGLLYLVLCIVVAWVYRLCLTCFYKKIHL